MHFYNEISTTCFNHSFDEHYAATIGRGGGTSGWLGCIKAARQPACSGGNIFFRWFALQQFLNNRLSEKYDAIVISRTDFLWVAPHANVTVAPRRGVIFVPEGSDWGGLLDRHFYLSTYDAIRSLSMADVVVERADPEDQKNYLSASGITGANMEVAHMAWHKNILKMDIVRYPHSGMLVRDVNDPSKQRWGMKGGYTTFKGFYVIAKYPDEYDYLKRNFLV